MNGPTIISIHDATPEAAMAAIGDFTGPILMDLDETLYLRNSTEDFIDCARPGFVAAILMQLLDWIKPWRWTGGQVTRDVWRVRLVMTLFPWTRARWRRQIPHLIREFTNRPLADVTRRHPSPPIIVTMGFRSIVTPLIAALQLGENQIVAVRVSSCVDRLRGKLQLSVDALGEKTVRDGLVLTDSIDDLPLLDACERPLRTFWPGARYRTALSSIYLPGRYLTQVKRPGERYIVRAILQEDFAFWLLCTIGLAASPLPHVLGLLFLLLSFWTIYECGYVDNDRVGARFEEQPKLSAAFVDAPVATPRFEPWIWALGSGGIAIALLRWPNPPTLVDLARWSGLLLATYGWFALYNRFDKPTRVWLFSGLQIARVAAFLVLVPVSAIGTAALGAHVLAKWLPYYVYRFGSVDWPETRVSLTRLLFFVVLTLLLVMSQGFSVITNGVAVALLAWNLYRARDELQAVVISARRLDRPARTEAHGENLP